MASIYSSKRKFIIIQISQWKLTVIQIIHHLLHSEDAIYNIFSHLYINARKIFNAYLCSMAAILKKWPPFLTGSDFEMAL